MSIDLIGRRFFKIAVLARAGTDPLTKLPTWHARCLCGREHLAITSSISRKCIRPVHCPCSVLPKRPRKLVRHGMSRSREYTEWRAMLKRCSTPTARRKAIRLRPMWKDSFSTFLADVGPCPTPDARLVRISRKAGWEPGNVAWKEAGLPRRRADARLIEYKGEIAALSDWAKLMGMHPQTLHSRLADGWPVGKALLTPVRPFAGAM